MEWIGTEKYNRMEVKNVLAELIKTEQLETIYRCNRLNYKWIISEQSISVNHQY
jgi:hypothetical protein